MAKQLIGPDSKVEVNGQDLSQFCTSFTVEDSSDEVDVTGFGQDYREIMPGLRTAAATGEFLQSYGSAEVDATIGAQYYARSVGTVKVTPDTGGTVMYTLENQILSFSPVAGAVGEASATSVSFAHHGTAGLVRGTP